MQKKLGSVESVSNVDYVGVALIIIFATSKFINVTFKIATTQS